mmetsp:Transcript_33790/g.52644  ORF Transcript_33790/g.52644 Transcript_33790/m.52644 type:complete len:218 (+) Transcript_33790:539-1192(+)
MWPESNRKRLAESKGVTSCCPMGAKGVRGKRVKTGRLSRKQFLCRLQGQSLVVHNLHRRKSLSLKEIRQQRHSQQPTRSTELRAWTVCLVMSQVTQRTTAMSLQKKSRGCLRKQGSSSRKRKDRRQWQLIPKILRGPLRTRSTQEPWCNRAKESDHPASTSQRVDVEKGLPVRFSMSSPPTTAHRNKHSQQMGCQKPVLIPLIMSHTARCPEEVPPS